MTIIAINGIVRVAENIIIMVGRTDKIILCSGLMDRPFILVLAGIITDLSTDTVTRDTIAMVAAGPDADIIDTNVMAESLVNVVRVSWYKSVLALVECKGAIFTFN